MNAAKTVARVEEDKGDRGGKTNKRKRRSGGIPRGGRGEGGARRAGGVSYHPAKRVSLLVTTEEKQKRRFTPTCASWLAYRSAFTYDLLIIFSTNRCSIYAVAGGTISRRYHRVCITTHRRRHNHKNNISDDSRNNNSLIRAGIIY